MTKLRRLFSLAIMDKDSDKAYIKQGTYRHAENLRFQVNNGSDGVGNSIEGTLEISNVTDGNTDFKCVGAYFNENIDVIYYFLATSNKQKSKIVEYDIFNDTTTVIIEDNTGKLKLDKNGFITGINEINGLLLFSEWGNNPRRLNVERAKTYGINNFVEDDISVIVNPPLQKLRIELENTDTETDQENNIEEKMLSFSYRYRYLDGEYSALAPFTEFAFIPKKFNYDFSEQSNRTMINNFNQVSIDFFTGSERVVEIQLIFKETESNSEWIIDDFNKELLGYGHNEIKNFKFNNSKVYRALPDNVIRGLFDNVPRSVKSQTMIEGRLLYANYLENYNILDNEGNQIELDHKLSLVALENTKAEEQDFVNEDGVVETETVIVPTKIPKRTCKSDRDYQVDMVYADDNGRITTVLNSKTNTIYIPIANSVTENSIHVELNHKPPYWAKYYRFFIKQAKKGYDQILPTLFYEDGSFRWIKLEGADIDKVKAGMYLTVKSDTQGVINSLIKVKVLEVRDQPKNFLQPLGVTALIVEKAGLYFKIKPKGFRVDLDDYENFSIGTYDNTRNKYNSPIRNISTYIDHAHFYGDTLDDLTVNQGSNFTGANDSVYRYLVKIDSIGANDTFRWSEDNGASWGGTSIPIVAGTPHVLSNGVEVTFVNITGHSILDEWNINARGTWTTKNSGRAYGFFRTTSLHNEPLIDLEDEVIQNGARLSLSYDEYGRGDDKFIIDVVTSDKYDNIEEWFIKENIMNDISAQCGLVADDIHFMRGILVHNGNATEIIQDNVNGTMTMCVRSVQHGTGTKRVKVGAQTNILQAKNDNLLLFETQPKDQPADIYYEVGRTYKIINNLHTKETTDWQTEIPEFAGDQSQTALLPLKVKLDWFNAYSYGNAVESYKIKDEFNQKGLAVGIRQLTSIRDRYKEVTRIADITWSDIYDDETDFNGLGSFNLSLINFIKLDKEVGSIQKLYNSNGNLMVMQEDALGLMPYNKNIIYDTEGNATVGISNNILDEKSYRPYADGLYGISKNPESFVAIGSRKYFTDRVRGDIIRLSINGVTTINQYLLEHYSSDAMIKNKDSFLVGGYDSKHGEYVLSLPESEGALAFKENSNGFPNFYTFQPDFMLNANNEFYGWKNGVMYRFNATETRNNFFGEQYESKLKLYFNEEFDVEKVWNSIGLESSHAWNVNLKTNLTSREIPRESFERKEDFWFSEIMGNTNDNTGANSIFGLGSFEIINGEIFTSIKHSVLSVGDMIINKTSSFAPNKITAILSDRIVLETPISEPISFLMYKKNQNIDGSAIRGDILEVEMTINETEKVEIRAVTSDVSKSGYS